MLDAESALKQFVKLLQQISRTFNGVFFLYDAIENSVVLISQNYTTLFGRPAEEVYRDPKLFLKAVFPSDRGKVLKWFRKGLEGSISSTEYRVLLPYGETRWQTSCLGPICDDNGSTIGLIGLTLDVTRQMNAEHSLRQSHAQMRQVQKMEALGTLLAGVAHEINNPINTLILNISLLNDIWRDVLPILQEKAQKEPGAKFGGVPLNILVGKLGQVLDDTDEAVNRASKIVQHLKEFARPAPVVNAQETSLNLTVENTLRLCSSSVHKARVKLQTNFDREIPPMLANRTSLEEILINLVMNAAEAIDHDHGVIEVRTGQDAHGGMIRLEVADNGRGVPEEIADRLFEPFVTQRPKGKGKGSGLGLSVTRNLVEECGGMISYESSPGQGTVFKVLFPLNHNSQLTQVLLVEDDQIMRRIIQKALGDQAGISLRVANNGMEALVKLGRYTPDVIVMDLFMPGMGGLELIGHIKSQPALNQIKLLVITGLPDSPEAHRIQEAGLAEVIPKTSTLDDFVDILCWKIKNEESC